MILINLLPAKARKRKVSVGHLWYAYLGTVAFVSLLLLGVGWYMADTAAEMRGRLNRVREEVNQYARYEGLLQEMSKKKQTIDRKREIIRDLQRDRDTVVRMLALISAVLPAEKISLEKLSQAAGSMTLDGIAVSNESIAEFMRSLEGSPYVVKGTVNLTHSRQTLLNKVKLREFQITYRFVPFSEMQKHVKAQSP